MINFQVKDDDSTANTFPISPCGITNSEAEEIVGLFTCPQYSDIDSYLTEGFILNRMFICVVYGQQRIKAGG